MPTTSISNILDSSTPASDLKRRLTYYRDDWKDEIPTKIVHSNSSDCKWKVRKGWFQGVVWCTWLYEHLHQEGKLLLSPQLRERFFEFQTFIGTLCGKALVTPLDIQTGNDIIQKTLAELEMILSQNPTL